ncbi:cytochrome P450 [Micromonospora sp. CA-240977]|uniref:cytochrome P450 n=1 Tax=Micromonospora sp. CA-240977 TaxID=3239957 RepID=UPI003D94220C
MSDVDGLLTHLPEDPYPLYDVLRNKGRVLWLDGAQRWLVTGHEEALAVLRHPRMSSDRTRWDGYRPAPGYDRSAGMFTMDPPGHTRLRGLVQRAFTARVVEGLRPRIQQLVTEFLDAAEKRGEIDLIADFAGPLPAIVLAELLGIPSEGQLRYRRWATTMMGAIDPVSHATSSEQAAAGQRADDELTAYLGEIIALRRRDPRPDLISALLAAEESGQRLTGIELLEMCILLTVAGLETSVNLIGNGVGALLAHPAQLARLRDEPELLNSAIEELLRYDAPIQLSGRVPTEDIEIDGQTLRKGQMVGVVLGAANRDERAFTDPHELDLGRSPNNHVAFGRGIHFCLGAPLARIEGATAIGELVRRFPGLRPAGKPQRRTNPHVRGFTSLPVALR